LTVARPVVRKSRISALLGMDGKHNARSRSVKSRFEHWFRSLTSNQVRIFLLCVLAAVVVITLNNPAAGYTRTSEAVRTPSMELALQRWQATNKERWSMYKWLWQDRKEAPEGGYFYLKKNPWWWIFAYESDAYTEWVYDHDEEPSPLRVETLGGLLLILGFLVIAGKLLMWLVEIRAPARSGHEP